MILIVEFKYQYYHYGSVRLSLNYPHLENYFDLILIKCC